MNRNERRCEARRLKDAEKPEVKILNGGRSKDAPRIPGSLGLGPVPWGANKFNRRRNHATRELSGVKAWAAREIHTEELKAHLAKTPEKRAYFVRTGKRMRAARRP